MIIRALRESIELDNGVTIEVITASKAAPRGRMGEVYLGEDTRAWAARFLDQPHEPILLLLNWREELARRAGEGW